MPIHFGLAPDPGCLSGYLTLFYCHVEYLGRLKANQTIFLIFLPSLFMGERLIVAPLVSTRVHEREVVEIVVFLKGPCGC